MLEFNKAGPSVCVKAVVKVNVDKACVRMNHFPTDLLLSDVPGNILLHSQVTSIPLYIEQESLMENGQPSSNWLEM